MLAFSPPDITQEEIDEVVDTLKSGWITTGPKTKKFEAEIAAYCNTPKAVTLASATAALEIALRLLGIGPGDEVITSAYTYTASASSICHVGATPVLVDTAPGSFEMDYSALDSVITERTKAVIPVDLAGIMADYDSLFAAIDSNSEKFEAANDRQASLGRIAVIADGAHSFGAMARGKKAGQAADLTAFSFHAVKNLTTSEGGALTWRSGWLQDDEVYKEALLMALHGQTKDALAKTKAGSWEYDILFPGWKCNMTDIQAALGLAQLRRYKDLLSRRRELISLYENELKDAPIELLSHGEGNPNRDGFRSSAHLLICSLPGKTRPFRDELIKRLGEKGVPANVHYKPLPMLTAYKNLGFDIADFPNAAAMFESEITLPLHTLLTSDDVKFIASKVAETIAELDSESFA